LEQFEPVESYGGVYLGRANLALFWAVGFAGNSMRTEVTLTIAAGVAGFALCAYILTYMTTRHEPVEWQNGDLVFQTATMLPNEMVLDATASPLTNVGIVAVSDNGPTVINAGPQHVDEVRMSDFVAQGKGGTIAAYRVHDMTPERGAQIVAAARRQLGKPYDVFFDKATDSIYSGELVRIAFSDIGVSLGQWVKLERLVKDAPTFQTIYAQQWSNLQACKSYNYDQSQCWTHVLRQQVITPASIAADEHVTQVYSDMPSVQALRPE